MVDGGVVIYWLPVWKSWRADLDSIVHYAEGKNTDLIVIGTKGRTGLKRFLLGSVASGVVAHAKCSVLVIR